MPKRYDLSKPGDARKWARGISRNIEKGFARNPVEIPIQAVADRNLALTEQSEQPTNVIHVHGGISGSSVVMGDGTANLNHGAPQAPKATELETAIIRLLERMPEDQIPVEDAEDLRVEGERALEELRADAPDEGKVARAVRSVRSVQRILQPNSVASRSCRKPARTAPWPPG